MKKIVALLLALIMVLGLAGCTNGKVAEYPIDDVYALSNVLKDVPYKLWIAQNDPEYAGEGDYWDFKTVYVKTLAEVSAFEMSDKNICFDYDAGNLYGSFQGPAVELDYVFHGKTVAELNSIAQSYYAALSANENTYASYYSFYDGYFEAQTMIDNGNNVEEDDSVVYLGVDYDEEDQEAYIYVYVAKPDGSIRF